MTNKLGKTGAVTMKYTAVYADGEGWSSWNAMTDGAKLSEIRTRMMTEYQAMESQRERALNSIHEIATSDSHMEVVFSRDQLAMANRVIDKMTEKLNMIADLVQVALGD